MGDEARALTRGSYGEPSYAETQNLSVPAAQPGVDLLTVRAAAVNLDVWITADALWASSAGPVMLQVIGKVRGIEAVLLTVDLSTAPFLSTASGSNVEGLAASVRGVYAEEWILRATCTAARSRGSLRAMAWGRETCADAASGGGGSATSASVSAARASATSAVVKASTGDVFSCSCTNRNAAARYFQLFARSTVPPAATVPRLEFLIPAGDQVVIGTDFFTEAGLSFASGIAWGFSTTSGTFTAGVAADCDVQVLYA